MQRVCVIEGITNLLFIASAPQCCSSPGMHPPSLSKLIRDRTELVILKCPRSIHRSVHDGSPCSQLLDSARFATNIAAHYRGPDPKQTRSAASHYNFLSPPLPWHSIFDSSCYSASRTDSGRNRMGTS